MHTEAALPATNPSPPAGDCFGLGCAVADQALQGGLQRGRLHEVMGAGAQDCAAAIGFALLLSLRGTKGGKPLFWVRHDQGERRSGRPDPYGLAALGIDPRRLLIGRTPDEKAALQAGLDAIRCSGLGGVLIEIWGRAPLTDLTATRRLAFAAERSGVTAFLVRVEAEARPSAAHSRWDVRSAPSAALAGQAPGFPAFAATLLRDRRGLPGFSINLEWDRDTGCFRKPPLSGDQLPLPVRRPAAAGAALARAA